MSKFCFFVSCTNNYIPYLNAFLNSLYKRKIKDVIDFDVKIISYNMGSKYIDKLSKFPFNIEVIDVDVEEIRSKTKWGQAYISKCSRYYYLNKLGREYDACALMDADLFLVSQNFSNLFHLVNNTKLMINCNERFKWIFGNRHRVDNVPIFSEDNKIRKFHCNTPMIIDVNKWSEVIEYYMSIVYRGKEHIVNSEDKKKDIGDIFSWNIAVQKQNRQNDVILLPMEVLTQVHQTAYKKWTELINDHGFWTTFSGEEVMVLHGRCGSAGFGKFNSKKIGTTEEKMEKINDIYKREWYDLNFNQCLILSEAIDINKHWENEMKRLGIKYG